MMPSEGETQPLSATHWEDRACFIAGSAKSGTTLLVSLLDGHPSLLTLPEETAYFPTVRRKYRHAARETQLHYLTDRAESRLLFAAEAIPGNRDYSDFPRERFRADFESAAREPRHARTPLLLLMAQSYARMIDKPPAEIARWIEKTPANRYCLPDIRSEFPKAKILLMMRDPRAILAAYLQRRRKKGGTLSFYACVENWRQSASIALAAKPEDAAWLKVVRFEHLVNQPEREMRDVCNFLEVDFSPDVLTPTKIGRAWRGNSGGREQFKAIDPAPAERWRTVLQPAELGWVEGHCRQWMAALNYEPLTTKNDFRHWLRKFPEESWNDYLTGRRHSSRDTCRGRWKLPSSVP